MSLDLRIEPQFCTLVIGEGRGSTPTTIAVAAAVAASGAAMYLAFIFTTDKNTT